jgi:SP family galactose:H+ symporter-like MFS transporter
MDEFISTPPHRSPIFLFITAAVAAIGGFLFGYDTGIISGALLFILKTFPANSFMQEVIVSAVVLGALIGAISSGRLADRIGSKSLLIYTAITFILGSLIASLALNLSMLITGRFIIGIAIGIASFISPLFISEMAPAKYRGSLVLLNAIMITGGESIAFLCDYLLADTQSWRLMFATGLIPAFLLLIGMLLMPASPRWMVLQGNLSKAKEILLFIRHPTQVEAELNEIIQYSNLKKSTWSDLFAKNLQPVLFIGLGLGIFQQFVGINTVMYYGPSIFKTAGFHSEQTQLLATFGMGLINTLMSIVAVLIVDKIGRRRLLLGGILVAGISLIAIGWIFYHSLEDENTAGIILIFMMFYIAGYSLSLGSLFWLLIAEIYPLNIRGLAMSFVTAVQWAANFMVAISFLSILNSIGPSYTFWIYAAMCVLSFFFCYYLVPETRGISLEQIEYNLRLGKSTRNLGHESI